MSTNLSKVYSAELDGINAKLVEVEVDINVGLSSFTIVGLGDKAVSESKERVSSAIKNINAKPPTRDNRRVTVNLAPADVKKKGSQYDLAIAVCYLLASNQIKQTDIKDILFIGELALDGSLRSVPGVMNICQMAKDKGFSKVFIPKLNSKEASLINGINIYAFNTLSDVIMNIENVNNYNLVKPKKFIPGEIKNTPDIGDIKGQNIAKRALMIAASGGHNILFSGSPGTGKTMLAKSLVSILPDMNIQEAIEVTKIWSAAGLLLDKSSFISHRPFRSPHHSASLVSIIGGGQDPKPGEISLAHRGVLFLDEIPEFARNVLEALRQPLENGFVTISRIKNTITFPSKCMLVAAANPCPCGYFGDPVRECVCTPYEISKYQKKLSGPLLDRIDMQVWVDRVESKDIYEKKEKISYKVKRIVDNARAVQMHRMKKFGINALSNSEMESKDIEKSVKINSKARDFLDKALDKGLISARGFFKIIKIAQTISDINNKNEIDLDSMSEAFSYRVRVEQNII